MTASFGIRGSKGLWRFVRWTSFSVLMCVLPGVALYAQTGESPLRTFGYFQTEFRYLDSSSSFGDMQSTSFSVPQLNIMLQKDLARDVTSFINLEFINTFSTEKGWGDFNLEEAWVRYRKDPRLSLKFGLSIPVFNHLNEIKNRTPILPYIVRPLVYETSFGEFVNIEEFVPRRAFVQAYGFFSLAELKLDYALHLGNSDFVNNNPALGQTGVDTTKSMLVGGRTGIRWRDALKVGVSATWDDTGVFRDLPGFVLDDDDGRGGTSRMRLGADLSARVNDLTFEGEIIHVSYVDDAPRFAGEPLFYYGTLGYDVTGRLYAYVSHWVTSQNTVAPGLLHGGSAPISIVVPNAGFSYALLNRLTVKAQFARAKISIDTIGFREIQWYASSAVSIFF